MVFVSIVLEASVVFIGVDVVITFKSAVAVAMAVILDVTIGGVKVRKELDKRSTDGFGWIRTYNDDLWR